MPDAPDDLLERLDGLFAPPFGGPDLTAVRDRVTFRRRRRTGVAAVVAVTLLGVGAVGVTRMLGSTGDDGNTIFVGQPEVEASVPARWGGPVELVAGDDELLVRFEPRNGADGGVARLDPASGELTPVMNLALGGDVALGNGVLWAVDPAGPTLERRSTDGEVEEQMAMTEGFDLAEPAGPWRLDVGPDAVWAAHDSEPVLFHRNLRGGTSAGFGVGGDVLVSGPLAVDGGAWLGEPDGLQRLDLDQGISPGHRPLDGRRITALAADGDRIWVAASDGVGAAATVGWLPADAADDDELRSAVPLDGGVERLAVVDGRVCAYVAGANTDPSIRCASRSGGRPGALVALSTLDGVDGNSITALDGSLWATRWAQGQILRIDPVTGATSTVLDLPFDGTSASVFPELGSSPSIEP